MPDESFADTAKPDASNPVSEDLGLNAKEMEEFFLSGLDPETRKLTEYMLNQKVDARSQGLIDMVQWMRSGSPVSNTDQ